MKLKISRNYIFIIGVCIILLFMMMNRFYNISKSEKTNGTVINMIEWTAITDPGFTYSAPIIEFRVDSVTYTFKGVINSEVEIEDVVEVLYNASDPNEAEIFTFVGFWMSPLIYCLVPILVLGAAVFSFMKPSSYATLNLGLFKNRNDPEVSSNKYI